MLPAFVIGLREGLETVVIIGAIVIFLRVRQRTDLLPKVWRACLLAAAFCTVIGFVIRYIEVNLPWRQQEQFETIVGLVAVGTVTYMVVWMRKFPKDLRRDSDAAASAALTNDSGRGLVLLAFFAVLREGFEITLFVVATIGLTGRTAWLSTGGAFLGVAVALGIGVSVVRGTNHLDVSRFFRATALILVLSAAGILMTTVNTANSAGWITFGQRPRFDLAWLAPPGSVLSSFTTGMFGIQPYPSLSEVVVWGAYFLLMAAVVLWPTRSTATSSHRALDIRADTISAEVGGSAIPRDGSGVVRRKGGVAAGAVGVIALAVGLALVLLPLVSPTKKAAAAAKVLSSDLDSISCASAAHCVAVGDFLPLDKDSASGDPDGDGQATHTLVESSDGPNWIRDPSPDLGRGGDQLSSVSCPDADSCFAVGFYIPSPFSSSATTTPPEYPLIESETRGRWRAVGSPQAPPYSALLSVSCPTDSACEAVGYTSWGKSDSSSIQSFFIERFDGRSWSLVPLALPADVISDLNAISCPNSSTCVAVGEVASDPTRPRPLILEMNNGVWGTASVPLAGTGNGELYDVQCPAVGHCTAVGDVTINETDGAPLVLSQNGSSWNIDQSALDQGGDGSLTSVSCIDADDCVAAGTSMETAQRIVARVDGLGWTSMSSLSSSKSINAIICTTAYECLAAGSEYVNELGNASTLIAVLSKDMWTVEPVPVP